ncbi:family 10 glycosylhydrolase [Deferribacteraceae bacterium V6Fe1]|nr:family 10 glycosylhydrolase [Deferribacteraceae bacterium V6Fe1]
MLKQLVAVCLFLCSLSANAITLVDSSYYKVNGVQIFNFEKEYKYNLDNYFKSLKSSNVNTIFVRVFQNATDRIHFDESNKCTSGVYFKSEIACTVFDLLDLIIPYARKHDIKVFAWMATRSLSFLKDTHKLELEFRDGNIQNGYGINIFDKNARNSLIELFKELAMYDIDGILIQDDFILRMNEGLSDLSKSRYYVDYGKLPDNKDDDWYKWKLLNLSGFLDELRYETKKINPKIRFAVNIYYETPVYPEKGLKWYAQSLEQYKKLGFSYFAVMAYHEQIMDELKINFQNTLSYLNTMLNKMSKLLYPENILVKVQVREFNNEKTKIPKYKIDKVCELIKNYNAGIVLVPFENLSDLNNNCFSEGKI